MEHRTFFVNYRISPRPKVATYKARFDATGVADGIVHRNEHESAPVLINETRRQALSFRVGFDGIS